MYLIALQKWMQVIIDHEIIIHEAPTYWHYLLHLIGLVHLIEIYGDEMVVK